MTEVLAGVALVGAFLAGGFFVVWVFAVNARLEKWREANGVPWWSFMVRVGDARKDLSESDPAFRSLYRSGFVAMGLGALCGCLYFWLGR